MSKPVLSHISEHGQSNMVDVSHKEITRRVAVAQGNIRLNQAVFQLINGQEIHVAKGPVINTAIIAGTMAVKQTFSLIPLCHVLLIESCKFDFEFINNSFSIHITCTVITSGKTGAEMEALTGVSIAALTIYDMCKAVSTDMEIGQIHLVKKSGGKHDYQK